MNPNCKMRVYPRLRDVIDHFEHPDKNICVLNGEAKLFGLNAFDIKMLVTAMLTERKIVALMKKNNTTSRSMLTIDATTANTMYTYLKHFGIDCSMHDHELRVIEDEGDSYSHGYVVEFFISGGYTCKVCGVSVPDHESLCAEHTEAERINKIIAELNKKIDAINWWQTTGLFHPFRCDHGHYLHGQIDGEHLLLVCDGCFPPYRKSGDNIPSIVFESYKHKEQISKEYGIFLGVLRPDE